MINHSAVTLRLKLPGSGTTLPSRTTELQRSFFGTSRDAARHAASVWLSDFSEHGPITRHYIRVRSVDSLFIARLTYSMASAAIEPHEPLEEEAPIQLNESRREAMLSALARCSRTMSRFALKCREAFNGLRFRLKPGPARRRRARSLLRLRCREAVGELRRKRKAVSAAGGLRDQEDCEDLLETLFDFNGVLLAPVGAGKNGGGIRSQQR